ncbi:hypothetical protein N7492_007986 [Penicillium capsulatum]|uniref:Uncharacterized protein n=1 Tax=Penicillium capsulatum TaxID=69766 RepID=A0A9W9HNU5_9EURO|nr:hypothetical protein N7492_007986 [Penicillium capsulatum]KAJ6105393.1 hypothetical protein N7512_008910 [Penicillium capsulatum]
MTMGFQIPDSGLSLRVGDHPESTKPSQIMRLNLVQSTLDELIESLRGDQPVRLRLGKHPSIHYAGKSQSFHAYPETHRSEIYHTSDDQQNLYFAGVLSHSLEVEKAQKATAATDQALANLEESLHAFERGKESKKTHMIEHPAELKALQGSSSKGRGPKSKVDLERDRLLRTAGNRSLTSSPTLGAPKSPVPIPTPTSVPASQTKTNTRLDALKSPFIHLLAVRAVSTKFLARQTRSSIEDCSALAQKYGVENRLNREKFDLKDKSYKDLDVWSFPYPTQEDRQQAIDNAISAFDRMRISRTDKLWQALLPKEERGKGKCLSRLNLSTGPIKKAAPPRIQVDGVDEKAKEGDATGNDMDRGTAPRSTASTSKPRIDKDGPKRSAKKPNPANNNSTLTGRVTKKTERKVPVKNEKFKSDEFVHDSDDDDEEMPDAAMSPPAPSLSTQRPKEAKPAPPKKAPARPAPAKPNAQTSSAASKVPKSETTTPKLEPSQATKAPAKRPASRPSTSPEKPSPLRSSPPTNASNPAKRSRSDSQNQSSSSSSSSPLMAQLARSNKAKTAARPSKATPQTNGASKPSATNPLKRKADADHVVPTNSESVRTAANLEQKRRRAISMSSGGSTGSASPPMSQELLRQQLREKSQKFKQYYSKYRTLYDTLKAQANPPQADLDLLQKQHVRLQRMKREIWEEHSQLPGGRIA